MNDFSVHGLHDVLVYSEQGLKTIVPKKKSQNKAKMNPFEITFQWQQNKECFHF